MARIRARTDYGPTHFGKIARARDEVRRTTQAAMAALIDLELATPGSPVANAYEDVLEHGVDCGWVMAITGRPEIDVGAFTAERVMRLLGLLLMSRDKVGEMARAAEKAFRGASTIGVWRGDQLSDRTKAVLRAIAEVAKSRHESRDLDMPMLVGPTVRAMFEQLGPDFIYVNSEEDWVVEIFYKYRPDVAQALEGSIMLPNASGYIAAAGIPVAEMESFIEHALRRFPKTNIDGWLVPFSLALNAALSDANDRQVTRGDHEQVMQLLDAQLDGFEFPSAVAAPDFGPVP